MKTLTIVICNFNHERYLGEAVASALAQDYPATSVLVIDDGSTDRSVDIIASFGSRVQAVFKANGGQVSAYNLAIELVSSDYAIFLDADDVLYPNAVSEVVRAFEAGEYAKVQFRLDVIAAQGERTGSRLCPLVAARLALSVAACVGQCILSAGASARLPRSGVEGYALWR
jgi:glycosyltransferase involved in cell wall biosynthesis